MPATPILALPYPSASDTADVPRDIQALAVKLDGYTSLRPPLVTALPGSPVDGQECYFQNAAMDTAGVVWHLRYRQASSSAYKWEAVGQPAPLVQEITAAESTSSAAYVALATAGPAVTVPLAGEYDVDIGAYLVGGGNTGVYMSYDVGATAALDVDSLHAIVTSAGYQFSARRMRRKTIAAAATALTAKYRSSSSVASTISERLMAVRPIRVG